MKIISSLIIITLMFYSCGQTFRLSDNDLSWMPYQGNETLIFKSNTNEVDTIFLIGKETLWGTDDPVLGREKYEVASIICKHSDQFVKDGQLGYRYLQNYFFDLKKTFKKKAELVFKLKSKDAHFSKISSVKIDSLQKISPITLNILAGTYNDVYIIEGEDFLGTLYQRSNFVSRIYLSKSHGLIRYDKKDGKYWELAEIY